MNGKLLKTCFSILTFVFLVSAQTSNYSPVTVNDPRNDGSSSIQSETSNIETDNGTIIVGYNNSANPLGYSGLSISYDGGKTFIDKTAGFLDQWPKTVITHGDPKLLYDSSRNRVYYVCLVAGLAFFDLDKVAVAFSDDEGTNWQGFQTIGQATNFDLDKPWAYLLQDDGAIYVTFTDFRGYYPYIAIFSSYSTDGGLNFSQPVQVSRGDIGVQWSQVVAYKDKGNGKKVVDVFWTEFPNYRDENTPRYIIQSTSFDGGNTFNQPERLFKIMPTGRFDIYTGRWVLDGGYYGTKSGGFRVLDNLTVAIDNSVISPNFGTMYMTFSQSRRDNNKIIDKGDIFISLKRPGDKTWAEPVLATPTSNNDQWLPHIAVAYDGTIGLSWNSRHEDTVDNFALRTWFASFRLQGNTLIGFAFPVTPFFVPSYGFDSRVANNYFGDYDSMSAANTPRNGTSPEFHLTISATFRNHQNDPNKSEHPDQDVYYIRANQLGVLNSQGNVIRIQTNFKTATTLKTAPTKISLKSNNDELDLRLKFYR